VDLVLRLQELGHTVAVYDPLADPAETLAEYGITLAAELGTNHDAVVGAVGHSEFGDISLRELVRDGGLIADIKGVWRNRSIPVDRRYWSL